MVEVTLIEASRRAALQEMRRDERVWVLGEDVARGGLWGQYRDFLAEFGDAARRVHADLGVDHHGRGARLRAGRHAADHRDAHLRFRDVRDGRAGQSDRQGPLHVRRAGEARRGGAHAARHVAQFRRAALADAGGLVRAPAGRRRGDAVDAGRHRRPAGAGDPLGRSGAVLRSEGSVLAERRDRRADRADPVRRRAQGDAKAMPPPW